MARTAAELPAGVRLADQISLGVLTAQFPMEVVEQVLFETERLSERERALPAHMMVYYVIAMALYADCRPGRSCGVSWKGPGGSAIRWRRRCRGGPPSPARGSGWGRPRWRVCTVPWWRRARRRGPRARGIAAGGS